MKSGNPVLNRDVFETTTADRQMTVNGTINKTAILLALVVNSAFFTWGKFMTTKDPATIMPFLWGGAIGGLIVLLITMFKIQWVHITAPIYALLEGLFIGGLSAMMEVAYPGIVLQAVALTFGVMAAMLLAYRSGLIKATEKFKAGVFAATGGIALVYLVSMLFSMFGKPIPFIHEGGTFGILFSLFVVVIAALNLIVDFDFIHQGVENGAPKRLEWYGAFALTVTLVWLYLEILRLLAKLRR
jgi:uncharacterized YccA/Bax inhibitor family protein